MDLIPSDLTAAARSARGRLGTLSREAAIAAARGTPSQVAMANTAREAVFADALLAAMHARLEEFRSVAK